MWMEDRDMKNTTIEVGYRTVEVLFCSKTGAPLYALMLKMYIDAIIAIWVTNSNIDFTHHFACVTYWHSRRLAEIKIQNHAVGVENKSVSERWRGDGVWTSLTWHCSHWQRVRPLWQIRTQHILLPVCHCIVWWTISCDNSWYKKSKARSKFAIYHLYVFSGTLSHHAGPRAAMHMVRLQSS